MKKWIVTAAISGTATCAVDAETEEQAMIVAKEDGDWDPEWDTNTEAWRGGFIEAQEIE